jgi:hypothetical protein
MILRYNSGVPRSRRCRHDSQKDCIMHITRILALVSVFAFFVSTPAVAQKKVLQPGEVVLIGKLTHAMGVGGETTGWSLELKSDLTFEGQSLRSIEVSGSAKKLAKLADQEVKARGFIKHRHGVERKDWLVLEVTSIRLQTPTGTT